ncbi:hypothetical protein N7532_009884 [Penicillium argentinense]|uniref:Uncharacterized protein n=1 Tax=Penicillium argentinense TaxID=1131581 RepID=A0A9W9ENI6_9EURO|nr:uncharacterized protein N7532_009884 [Penicillium argentinense]KAJ5085113.1 hypothetical protein N7532_009884 [Penicillium argentinense]
MNINNINGTTAVAALCGVKPLHKTAHWELWFCYLRQYARDNHVWEFVDPDVPASERPERLKMPDFPENFYELSRNDQKHEMEMLRFLQPRWELQDRGLRAVKALIHASVEPHVDLLLYYYEDDIAARVRYLRDRFSRRGQDIEDLVPME